ncbi:MAG: hypothetical protein ACRDIU_09375 [Actinomycetota bacterium]
MKRTVRGVLRRFAGPLIAYIGTRFDESTARMNEMDRQISGRLDAIQERWAALERRLEDFQREIATGVQTAAEVMLTHQRAVSSVRRDIEELQELLGSAGRKDESEPASQSTSSVNRPL